jgi:hypothetical protein
MGAGPTPVRAYPTLATPLPRVCTRHAPQPRNTGPQCHPETARAHSSRPQRLRPHARAGTHRKGHQQCARGCRLLPSGEGDAKGTAERQGEGITAQAAKPHGPPLMHMRKNKTSGLKRHKLACRACAGGLGGGRPMSGGWGDGRRGGRAISVCKLSPGAFPNTHGCGQSLVPSKAALRRKGDCRCQMLVKLLATCPTRPPPSPRPFPPPTATHPLPYPRHVVSCLAFVQPHGGCRRCGLGRAGHGHHFHPIRHRAA